MLEDRTRNSTCSWNGSATATFAGSCWKRQSGTATSLRTIRLAAATPADRIATVRSELDSLRTRRHLGYRESMAWADDAMIVVDEIATTAETAPSRELLKLVELAVGRVVKVIMYADDSSGAIGDVARRLLEIHEQLGDAGVADPKALAKWMIRFSFDDQDFFNPDPVRYAAALGDSGLAVVRREVDERMAAPDPDFAVRYVQERLAILDGDVDRVVELLGGDLDRPYDFIRVAEAMLELDRPDDALAWARRGIDSVTGWQVAQLYDIAAGVIADRGDDVGVFDLRREQHRADAELDHLRQAEGSGRVDRCVAGRAVCGAYRARCPRRRRPRRRAPRRRRRRRCLGRGDRRRHRSDRRPAVGSPR